MESGENIVNARPPEQNGRGCYRVNLILNAFIAVGLGIAIILILTIFNRSGHFAFLSGLFGALLYCAVVFPRLLFGHLPNPGGHNPGIENGNNPGNRRSARVMSLGGFAVSIILAMGAGIGLCYIPTNQPIFAFIDALLAIGICIALFIFGLSILSFLFGRGQGGGNGVYFDL